MFYFNGIEKIGPFTIDELKDKAINQNTLIWTEGMPDCKRQKMLKN
ncbi:MAG: DUF4339 domain-containing protein [Saprospiraceae bacterium]|nr:DUF4339 domain-containing protein [Saprospiraceae bacterium]